MRNRRMKKFYKICKYEQTQLKNYLEEQLSDYGYKVAWGDGYLYAKGDIPVLLTAHLDTVHTKPVDTITKFKDKNGNMIIFSPEGIGGDDRCGVYMILHILKETKLRPSILFCEDEEIGGKGSEKFCKTKYIEDLKKMKFLLELDRANKTDAVFYDCGNTDFINFILEETGYEEEFGSFSDISNLSPVCDVASVNLSCGYYNQHTLQEYVIWEEMLSTIKIVEKLLIRATENDVPYFDFQEIVSYNYGKYNKYLYTSYDKCFGYTTYNDDFDYDSYKNEVMVEFIFLDGNKEKTEFIKGDSFNECLGILIINNPKICYEDILDWIEY